MAIIVAQIKRYAVPIALFSIGLFFQLVLLPNSYPASHYDVLGISPYSSVEDVAAAYERISARWSSGPEMPSTADFVKVRYASELLTNPAWKRDYDLFGIDEQKDIIKKVKKEYHGVKFSDIPLPLLEASPPDNTIEAVDVLTSDNFASRLAGTRTMLIQVYSNGSPRCARFLSSWKRIASLLYDVADTGMLELGEIQLASSLAEKKYTKQPYFRNGLPALVAFPSTCRSSNCVIRYGGEQSVDAVIDWMATDVLGLPRILYYTKETLASKFFAETAHHKVKVILFSKTGERAAPFLRQAAKDYWAYASFALVLWREEDSSLWWNMLDVESAPAMVILKDPGVQPVVYHGSLNNTQFLKLMENNKQQELPQLRRETSMELGCDANGYSRAGENTVTWYCLVLAGRPSLELNKMRETMRKVQHTLASNADTVSAQSTLFPAPTADVALQEKRLTFAWLDGEVQQKYCLFNLYSEHIQETCGPRGYTPTEVPRLFIVRYKRNSTENKILAEGKAKNIWNAYQKENNNLASQLVARYNGTENIQEILKWISQIIEDGDTSDLPYFVDNTPELVPDGGNPIFSKGAQGIFSTRKGLKHRIQSIIAYVHDLMMDPRVGPLFLLGACLSFGTIWLKSSQPSQVIQTGNGTEGTSNSKGEKPKRKRPSNDARTSSTERPASITDEVPKDAYQLLPSDSDSE